MGKYKVVTSVTKEQLLEHGFRFCNDNINMYRLTDKQYYGKSIYIRINLHTKEISKVYMYIFNDTTCFSTISYGDTLVWQPKTSEIKDLLKIKLAYEVR